MSVCTRVFCAGLFLAMLTVACDDDTQERRGAPRPASTEAVVAPVPISLPPLRPIDPIEETLAMVAPSRSFETMIFELPAPAVDEDDVYHFDEAMGFVHEGRIAEAISELERAIEVAPEDHAVLRWLARCQRTLARWDDAVVTLEEMAKRHPDDLWTLESLARVHMHRGHHDTAIGYIDEVIRQHAGRSVAHNIRGRILSRAGDNEGAIAAFESAIEHAPGNPFPFNNLGLVFLRTSHPDAAVEALELAVIHSGGDHAYMHNNLGLAYEQTGRYVESREAFARVIEMDPKHTAAQRSFVRVNPLAIAVIEEEKASRAALLTY